MLWPVSPSSRPGPFGWPSASLDGGCGRPCRPGTGCRRGCGWRALFGWSGWESAGLVVPRGVQGEFADELAGVGVDDADVQVVDEQGAGEGGAEADVVEPGIVSEADPPQRSILSWRTR